jgi:hypothetical protein
MVSCCQKADKGEKDAGGGVTPGQWRTEGAQEPCPTSAIVSQTGTDWDYPFRTAAFAASE